LRRISVYDPVAELDSIESHDPEMAGFVAHTSVWRLLCVIPISIAFVTGGLWMAGAFGPAPSSGRYSPEIVAIIGWFSVLFSGFVSLAAARRVFDSKEELRIGSNGVLWRRWSDDVVPWSEIEDVTSYSVKRQKFIVLHLRDPDLFPARGLVNSLLASVNRHMTGGDICITLGGTDRSFDEAADAILRFRHNR